MPLLRRTRTTPADHPAFAGLPVRFITLSDGRTRAAAHISGPLAPEAPPLICVAGYHRNMSDFSALVNAMKAARPARPIVLVDLPGRGRADDRPQAADYNSLSDARDLADVISALGIGRAVILGQSHGGQVAMALAARHPLLVAGTILVDAGPVTDSRGIVRLRNNLAHLDGIKGSKVIHASQRRMLAGDYPGHDPAALDALAARTHWIDKRGHARALFDTRLIKVLDSFNFDDVLVAQWELFDALSCAPLMLLRTQMSDQLRRETFDDMVRRRPDATALTIAGQGSPALFDEREEIEAINAFADAAETSRRGRRAA